MTGLAEIEAAVDQLPEAEQKALLEYLTSRIAQRPTRILSPDEKRIWMDELQAFRESISRIPQALTSEQIINELREE